MLNLFSKKQVPSRDALRQELCAMLVESMPDVSISQAGDDPEILTVTSNQDGSGDSQVYLGNILDTLERTERESARRKDMRRFVVMARNLAAVESVPLDPEQFYIGVRHEEFAKVYEESGFARQGPGDCKLVLLEDCGSHIRNVSRADTEKAGISEEQAWEAAERNMSKLKDKIAFYPLDDGAGALGIEEFEWMANSLILVPSLFEVLMKEEQCDTLWLAAPSREEVTWVNPKKRDPEAFLRPIMSDALRAAHPQSEMVFELRSGDPQLHPIRRLREDDVMERVS